MGKAEVDANVEDCLFFKRLCCFNRTNFTKYRRGTDHEFFKLYTSLVGQEDVKQKNLDLFPRKPGDPVWTLTVSHKQRRLINLKVNELIYKRNPQGFKIEADQQVDRQAFWLMKGQHVAGALPTLAS